MVTIQQTVTVPADRRIYFDLPENTPAGTVKVKLTLKTVKANASANATPPLPRPGFVEWILHPVRSYRGARFQSAVIRATEKLAGVFDEDGVILQRRWRDEWN